VIDGVHCRVLQRREDDRGGLTEVYRATWAPTPPAVQFNVVDSSANVLRGVHLHRDHFDYLMCLRGRALIALFDCRAGSPTFRCGDLVVLEDLGQVLTIPVGVAHGFWLPEPAVMMYGVDREWEPGTDLQCRWDDQAIAPLWSRCGDAHPSDVAGGQMLSEADAHAGGLDEMITIFNGG